jgi:hypothetical protein
LRSFVVVIACLGLAWSIPNLASSAVSDEFYDLDARLLQFESLKPASAARILQNAKHEILSPCDNHAQHALLLMEIPLAEIALRSGNAQNFDRHIDAIESRSKQILGCTPRDSLVWLLLFGIEIEHGSLGSKAFDLLEMSYETSPNEGWLGVRRMTVAVPVMLAAPEAIQEKILAEFERLVTHRLVEIPARAYSSAPTPVRALLQSRIDKLDVSSRKVFSDALAQLHRS